MKYIKNPSNLIIAILLLGVIWLAYLLQKDKTSVTYSAKETCSVMKKIHDLQSSLDKILIDKSSDKNNATNVSEEIVSQIKNLSDDLRTIEDNQKKCDLLNRVEQKMDDLIKQITIMPELSEKIDSQFAAIEKKIKDSAWMSYDDKQLEQLSQDVALLIDTIPVKFTNDYLQRLNVIRWSVSAIQAYRNILTADSDKLENQVDAVSDLLDIMPFNADVTIKSKLEETFKKRTEELEKYNHDQIILNAREVSKLDTITITPDYLQKHITAIQELDSLGQLNDEEQKLRHLLFERQQKKELDNFIKFSDTGIEESKKMNSDVLLLAAYSKAYEESFSMLQGVLNVPEHAMEVENKLRERCKIMAKKAKDISEQTQQKLLNDNIEKTRDYQRWALGQIKLFNDEYKKAIGVLKDDKRRIANAATKYLLPISSSYLDIIVSRLYAEAINNAYDKLKLDDELKKDLAIKEVTVIKKMPTDNF